MADRVTAAERMLNLVLALQHTRFGLTKRQILARVAGYADDLAAGTSLVALERRFERDKAALRGLGIEVIASDDLWAPGDNQLTRYHIDEQSYALPEDVELDADDLSLLAAAALLLARLDAPEGRRVVARARALTAPTDELVGATATPDAGFSLGGMLDLMVYEPNLRPLQRAVLEHEIVRFDYHTQEHERTVRRTVLPLALVLAEGRWHLHGVDIDRRAQRTFLLQRIRGIARSVDQAELEHAAVRAARGVAEQHDDAGWAALVLDELRDLREQQIVRLRVRPGSEAAVRLGDRLQTVEEVPEGDTFDLHSTDVDLLADELCGYGDEVTVLAPQSMQTRMVAKLRRLIHDHASNRVQWPSEERTASGERTESPR